MNRKNDQSSLASFSFIWQVFIEIVYIIYPKAPFILLKRPPPDLGFLVVVVAAGLAELSLHLPVPTVQALQLLNFLMHGSLLQSPLSSNFPQSYLVVLPRSNLRM